MKNTIFLSTVIMTVCACGSEDPGSGKNDAGPMATPFIPIAVGNSWTYRVVSGSNVESTKVQTIIEEIVVDGEAAYVFETVRANDKGTRSIQRLVDNRLIRLSEETLSDNLVSGRFNFVPPGLRIDGNFQQTGETYQDTHDKQKVDANGEILETETRAQTFEIESGNELISVPAGEFNAIRVRRTRSQGTTKTYWFVEGLGKIKELGGQSEELVKFVPGN